MWRDTDSFYDTVQRQISENFLDGWNVRDEKGGKIKDDDRVSRPPPTQVQL